MEENLMERLINDFNGVLEEFNQLVKNNDIDGVKKVLNEVNRLIQERNGIVLDDREPEYDHVLHELLDKMEGVVEREITVKGIDGVPGSRYYTNAQIEEMISEAEAEQRRLAEIMSQTKDNNDEAYANARSERSKLIARIASLKSALVPNQEFSSMTYVDENLEKLQAERAKLVQEKMDNLKEIARLREEETATTAENPENQVRLDEINSRISELEELIPGVEGQINGIKETKISQIIENLRAQTGDRTELQARLAELQNQLRASGERIRATRGFDEQNAQAISEQFAITTEINNLQSQLDNLEKNQGSIEFLESFLPTVEVREPVLEPMDYTYMGRLTDEQIIRRLLSEQLNLSEEEINERIGEYSLISVEEGAHDEQGEDNPISMRQLVRTRAEKGDLTVGEAIENLEAQLHNGQTIDHTEEIAAIDNRISELDTIISNAEARIAEIQETQLADIIAQRQENARNRENLEARLANLQNELRAAGERVRETRGFDEQYAQARADYSALTSEINNIQTQINSINPNESNIDFLESLIPTREEKEPVLEPMDYTYMGRLKDEQIIRRLLSEQLNLSEEEINEKIGEYSLDAVEVGAHDEQDEDNPISMRQLVRTKIVQEPITVKEAYEKQLADLQSRLAQLQSQLRAAGDRIKETKGFDEQNAQAHADYNELLTQIRAVEGQIKETELSFKEALGIKEQEDIIAAAKAEQEELRARKKDLEQENEKSENAEVRDRLNRLKEVTGISALEAQLQAYKDEYDKLKEERDSLGTTKGKSGVDNSKRIAELEARNKEIINRIAEIDREITKIPGTVPIGKITDKERLDVKEEAHRIGDHIFKTAEIRRELAAREVSRDEFLEFYQQGFDKTNEQIEKLYEDYQKINEEVKVIIVDSQSGVNLSKQIKEAEKNGDTELVTKLYENLRKNFITAGREDQLKQMGIDHEITSKEDIEKMKEFFDAYKESVVQGKDKIKTSVSELKENAQIFSTEIARIKAEKATLELTGEDIKELEDKSAQRKDMRRALLEASITPEKDLTDEQIDLLESWQKASERFLSKKTTKKFVYIDKEGNEQVLDVDSIDDTYKEYNKDIEFLGVPAYKENLEQLSAYGQTNDPYVFGEEVGIAYDNAEAQRPGAGREVIERIMADKQKYVETFNGIPNPHKVKYENWKTAGSTLKGMKPVSRDLPMPTRARNALENVGRFLGIRVPKFTRLDEHGNEVRDVKGGVATLALDGLVTAGVIGTAVTLGPIIPAVGYAAKGIVTAGNRIAARIEYSRHKDEIDNNKPVINQADRNAREVARKEYYREKGDNRFVSWIKAKSDKYFTRNREKETEQAIVDELAYEFEAIEDDRVEGLKYNLEVARANQEARSRRQAQIAMGANAYNDIVRDPDSIDMEEATATIARNAALEASKPGAGKEDVNKNSNAERKEQYVKEEKPVEKTHDLDLEVLDDKAIEGPVSAVTEEQIYTGRKQHVDRLNKVLTAVTAAGLKFAYTAWKDGFTHTETIHHDAEVREDVIHHEPEYGPVEVKDYGTQYDTSKTLDELRQNYAGKTANEYYSVSGGLRGQRTEALADKGITAGWFDDKSKWGTGISDTHGLSAPVLTDKLAESGLLDPNGVLRQDITVQQMLDAMGCTNPDLTTLDGIYMSVGDNYWVRLSELMQGMTKQVVTGSHMETQMIKDAWDEVVETVVKDAWDEEITKFVPGLVIKTVRDGALIGAGIGVADALHEAAQNTYIDGATPGRPEETTPEAHDSFETMAEKLQEKANKEKQLKDQERNEEEQESEQGDER